VEGLFQQDPFMLIMLRAAVGTKAGGEVKRGLRLCFVVDDIGGNAGFYIDQEARLLAVRS